MMLLLLLVLSSSNSTAADEPRPSEESMFGNAPQPAPSAKPSTEQKTQATPEKLRDAFATGEVTDNPLQVGGVYYQQLIISGQEGTGVKNTPVTAPMQVDAYLDGRPNDRIRAFVDGRLLYDPTRDQFSNSTNANSAGVQTLQTQSQTGTTTATGTTQIPNNPQVVLDQAWLKFDVDRKVFVTAGKQHEKWGVSRFWNPTDFLSTQKRNPLLPYDLRLGNYMVKLEYPLEAKGTNFYAIGLFDNPQPASTLGQMGGALRAETLIGNAEVGIEVVGRGTLSPSYGADISSAIGPFDAYAEVAVVSGSTQLFQPVALTPGQDVATAFTTTSLSGPAVQVSGGLTHDFAWREDREATIGFEYFYNQAGYNDKSVYPALIFTGNYQPFYTGRNYAALYLTAEGPDAEKHTSYTFSTLANLSDDSFISRVDFSWRFLTYLTLDAYVDGHYGEPGGEFNFALSTPALTNGGTPIPPISVPPTFFDLGFSLRVSI